MISRLVEAKFFSRSVPQPTLFAAADGAAVTLRVAHGELEDCVGQATAAFGMELLRGGVAPGCWYPAELPVAARARLRAVGAEGALVWAA